MAEYSCIDMPTVQQFMDSDAFMRGLMGPFGCSAGDTEFLTAQGWKRIDQYQSGDLVLIWHPNGFAYYATPSDYINEPSDELLLFDSGSLKMVISPEHRVPHWNRLGDFQVKTAAQIALHPSKRGIPTTFRISANHQTCLHLSHDLIRFAVMMHADGWYPPEGRRAIMEVHKERKKERIRQILRSLGVEWREFLRDDRPTSTRFSFEPPYIGKHFGGDWWTCNDQQLRIVLDEIEHWDGLHGHAEQVFTTTWKEDADFIQYAAHATGRRAAIHQQVDPRGEGKWKPVYFVRIRTGDNGKNRANISSYTQISPVPAPSGRKYCFTTETGFWVARYRDTIFITGNSGKSSACAIEVVRRALEVPRGPDGVRRSRFAIVRNTVKELEDTTERTVLQWLVPQQIGGDWTPSKHNYKIRGLRAPGDDYGAEIEIMFRALDRDDQIRDLLSLELTGAWVNEAREINWAIVDALQARVGRFPRKADVGPFWFGIWADTNPPDVDSDWFKFFEETDHTDAVADLARFIPGLTVDTYRAIFKQPSGRSPKAENLRNLADGYYQRLAIGKAPEWVKVYIDGEYGFVTDGKAVWPEYVDQIHCPPDKGQWPRPVLSLPIVRSWDFGLTPACVFSQITSKGQWIVFDELIATSMGADKFSDEVLDHSARYYTRADFWDIGDPAGMERAQSDETTCFQILHGKNIGIEAGLQTLSIRIESVSKPLRTLVDGRPQFVLHPRCAKLRRAMMGGYHFRKMRVSGERYTATPEKDSYSHVADALGYAGTRLFGAALYQQGGNRGRDDAPAVGRSRSITGY